MREGNITAIFKISRANIWGWVDLGLVYSIYILFLVSMRSLCGIRSNPRSSVSCTLVFSVMRRGARWFRLHCSLVVLIAVCFPAYFSPVVSASENNGKPIFWGGASALKLATVSKIRVPVFSVTDGYVIAFLKAELVGPNSRDVGFLKMPAHGLRVIKPTLEFKRTEMGGKDWAQILQLFRQLSLVEIEGPLSIQNAEGQKWLLSGDLRRHPDGVVFDRLLDGGRKQSPCLLINYQPKLSTIIFRDLSKQKP